MKNLIQGNSFKLIKKIPDNFIDLVITSPPYADIKSYGKKVNVLHPDKYVDWILPIFPEIYRVLKRSGSFILNVDDRCVDKRRHLYVFDLAIKANKVIPLYDYYIWYKRGGVLPSCGPKRLNHVTEFLFHFCKDVDKVKWRMDRVREPYEKSTIIRMKKPCGINPLVDNVGEKITRERMIAPNPAGGIPNTVFTFTTNAANKNNKHPAPFHEDMPKWFIKALTDKGDIVFDPFIGSGTTAVAAIKLGRKWLGFDLNVVYIEEAEKRIKKTTAKSLFSY